MSIITRDTDTLTIAGAVERLMRDGMPFRFEAYDGSSAGPEDADITVRLRTERGLAYLMTAPGDLGFGRAFVAGDLEIEGVSLANPYDLMTLVQSRLRLKVPGPAELLQIVRSLGLSNLKPPPPPPEEHLPRWRRVVEGMRHSKARDAEAIHHHYDVSNRFYELVLGPSMTYTCAVFPTEDATLEQAQYEKYDLVCRKLGLGPGDRLLDVGCGWGGMVRHAAEHYGVQALGVTLSEQQAQWAQQAIKDQGLDHLAEVRFSDYRDVGESDFDAVSSIGLMEHIGVRNYPDYFAFLQGKLRVGGRMLNHCITRRDGSLSPKAGAFIDRYVFPDGELAPVGTIVSAMHDHGLEVRHVEDIREHYALTLQGWSQNLEEHWDEALGEVSLGIAKVWGLYMAGSRLAFERNEIGLHQVLGVKVGPDGDAHMPLRPTWGS
ncbi:MULTISPECIES: class I SAM-dependent methyltransferase [unclassified Aeromicrobium]|uniref:class I SAM-dependent methyltransferase n=1 Tax=unclassified Aeromicrobium TaxID=2633570 RepID=UPI0006FA344B|nr:MULTISPECIES: class I SAM-dependent methyltransferase [unclassified Aeromicrobium]KQO36170.1 cyclopropane-fatty-acyl-phospholipid synthase [Aeromicrobium sp. Leaf245]KQP78610.1 cyclopropane-fatty-acyl-phospholipid synthase [Aeromicrobium sp. Leaf289]KQP84321.1 cyclopropane-fatty-acyl-phospholipid synthase [Aeromicrobium sp. Leaf291]